jgi:hypothetical protein
MPVKDPLMISMRSRMSFSCLLSWAENPAISRIVFWFQDSGDRGKVSLVSSGREAVQKPFTL